MDHKLACILKQYLSKIRDFFKILKAEQICILQSCNFFSEYAIIDEKLEGFQGKCSFWQYIPSKSSKYGIKIFALVDARTFYIKIWDLY